MHVALAQAKAWPHVLRVTALHAHMHPRPPPFHASETHTQHAARPAHTATCPAPRCTRRVPYTAMSMRCGLAAARAQARAAAPARRRRRSLRRLHAKRPPPYAQTVRRAMGHLWAAEAEERSSRRVRRHVDAVVHRSMRSQRGVCGRRRNAGQCRPRVLAMTQVGRCSCKDHARSSTRNTAIAATVAAAAAP
eukprot:357176-Chlamydomonas_euryale.AAC.2